ncbi:MAG: mmgE/PrpD family protein [Betaproteobacteria bacterium]|nr:mmgE/PrpD family protein [Betaproteobacteria bacterium]
MSSSATDNPYTREIAGFVSGLTYDSIPDEVRQRIKLLMLDALGCGIYAANLEWSTILQRTLSTIDTTRECTVWGTSHRLSAPHAALVNGTQVQGFELDDVHKVGVLHTGCLVLPPLFAITEIRAGTSGREFIAAAVAGYEIGPRVSICMGPEHIAQGWHSGATVGVYASAAAAARVLQLDADKTVHALGIAGTQSCGLMAAQFGSMVKRMHAGRAAQSGLYAAQLAGGGFTGIVNVFESEYGGFCTTFSRSRDRFNLAELTAGFGSVWQSMNVALKFYSCVGSTHSTLDAISELRAQHAFAADDIASVVVHGSEATVNHVGWKYVPQGFTAAQLNLSYCVATLLIDGEVFVDQFTEAKLTDPARMALAAKVSVVHDPAITARGPKFRQMVHVEIMVKDGTLLKRTREVSRAKETFAAESEVVKKFETLASHVLPAAHVRELRDTVLGLEKIDDAARLARLLIA